MNSTPSSIKDFTPIPIDSIKSGRRFRKDLGNTASLAEDIGKIGLLHPIVINQNHELICGLRRIEAFKSLGKSEIPAHIVNLDDIVKGEISENTQRKDFSLEEIIQIKKAVEPEIKTESKKRKLSGKPSAKFAEGSNENNNNSATSKNYSENQTRAQVAKYVSLCGKKISHATLAKAEKVYDAAQQDPTTFGQIWADLSSGKISPDKAYKDMQGIQTRHSDTVDPQPPTIKRTDKGKEAITQISRRDITECEHCQSKDSRIKELEEVVRKTTQLAPANQIAEGGDDDIKQLQNELDERTRELSDKTSQIDKLSDDLKHIKEDVNLNLANVDVSETGDFEFSLLLGDIKYRLAALYPRIGDAGKVWFSGKLDKESGRILSIRFGRLGDNV
jgi:ParB-like nuclease domain